MSLKFKLHIFRRLWSLPTVIALLAVFVVDCGGGSRSPTEPGAPPPVTGTAKIGVVGCSQTTSAWRGWLNQGDGRVWTLVIGYGGGAVTDWAGGIPGGPYWERFDRNEAANEAPNIIWWQLCDRNRPTGNVMHADAILNEIKRRHPGVTVYVTPLAEFENTTTCGKQNIANSRIMTDHLIMSGGALRGPELPLVLDEWVQPPQGDGGCHVGDDGSFEFGRELAGFPWSVQ